MASVAGNLLWKFWYPALTRLTRNAPVVFLNYGFSEIDEASSPLDLRAEDEADRPCIQLYHSVVKPVDLRGLRVLEVSCGHGGGASYIARYCNPASMVGVDRNARAIEFCQKQHTVAGLSFAHGNALELPFEDGSFDAVLNVEASHCYPDMPKFFAEVRRVLRPGGHFLYADFRLRDPCGATLNRQLNESGLELTVAQDISQNVVRGMNLNMQKYMQLITRLVPRWLRKPAMRFAGVPGSAIYEELKSGKTVYLRYVLRRPG